MAIEPDCGVSFIVVLDPDHEPQFSRILERSCALPVSEARDGVACRPNRVYVVPPHAAATLEAGRLRFRTAAAERNDRSPIDRFFVSLAEDQEEKASCVILPGAGRNGILGVRSIKAHGGIAFGSSELEKGGGARNGSAAEFVDLALPTAELPARLRSHFSHLNTLVEGGSLERIRNDIAAHLPDICDILRVRTGYDFSGYRSSAAMRGIQRRMNVLQIPELAGFVRLLKAEPREADLLFQDLLVSVTRFFHHEEAFAALECEVIPQIMSDKSGGDTIRVWVPGCATGEEVYAVAMLLCERAPAGQAPQIQVFASDIDDRSLALARGGRYPASIEESVTAERLQRFFVREDGSYRVTSELRDKCLFTNHNLLRDPPFSRLDLIICRNVLIHLDAGLQNRIVPLFHYALRDGGYLFMGESENVTDASLFEPVHREHRIFRKRSQRATKRPGFPISARAPAQRPIPAQQPYDAPASMQTRAEQQVLERYAPAHVITNPSGEILYTSGRTGHYFEMAGGAPRNSVFALARPGLRQDLRTAFDEATTTQQTVTASNLVIEADGQRRTVDLIVQPLDGLETPDATYMLVFRDVGGAAAQQLDKVEQAETGEDANVRRLERDLSSTRELLQTTVEELQSSNEELRSANEELSSVNEELSLVNSELNVRVDELSAALSDISNLLESTQIATVFLDRKLRLRFFTPAAKDFYHLAAGDLGRPIADLRPCFDADTLQVDAQSVLLDLQILERRVRNVESGDVYDMRVLPYRTPDDLIDGVVITFARAS